MVVSTRSIHRKDRKSKIAKQSKAEAKILNFSIIIFDLFIRFIDMYRMPKTLARLLIEEISEFVDLSENPNKIPLHLEVLATLNFLGCGSFQKRVGRDAFASMSQSSISLAVTKICEIISTQLAPDM